MSNLSSVLVQLRDERKQAQMQLKRLSRAIGVIESLLGWKAGGDTRIRRTMSAAARKRISAAQKARWAKWKARQKRAD